jgi:hypothetical protein
MSEEGESPQPEEQQPPQQKVAPTFMAYPAHAAVSTNSAAFQRIHGKRMPASQRYAEQQVILGLEFIALASVLCLQCCVIQK